MDREQSIADSLTRHVTSNNLHYDREFYLDLGGDDGKITEKVAKNLGIDKFAVAEPYDTGDVLVKDGIIDLDNERVSVLTASMSMHHFGEHFPTELNEMARITKKGALLIIREHDVDSPETAAEIEEIHFDYHVGETENYEQMVERSQVSFTSKRDLEQALQSVGFWRLLSTKPRGPQRKYIGVFRKSRAPAGSYVPKFVVPSRAIENGTVFEGSDREEYEKRKR